MNIKTKRGSLDNIVTYEHYCDTIDDLQQIPLQYITLGSVAIVLQGQNDGFEVYMANSNHEWVSLGTGGGGEGGSSGDKGYTEIVNTWPSPIPTAQPTSFSWNDNNGYAFIQYGPIVHPERTIAVIFDGERYVLPLTQTYTPDESSSLVYNYGATYSDGMTDFTDYPISIRAIAFNWHEDPTVDIYIEEVHISPDFRETEEETEDHMLSIYQEWVSVSNVTDGFKQAAGISANAVFDAHFVDDIDGTINEQVFNAGFFVDADPAEIIAAYKAGKHVVIHFIADEASRGYSTFYDGYYSLLGYDENNIATNGGFRFFDEAVYGYGVGITGYGIDEVTGKLAFSIYID